MPADKLLEAYGKFLDEPFLNYKFAEGLLRPLGFTPDDAIEFCHSLGKHVDNPWFRQSGYFLSAMANRILDKESELRLDISSAAGKIDFLGNRMVKGRLVLAGDAGDHLGFEMLGGEIVVHGSAGNMFGDTMMGGRIVVNGNVGDFAGVEMRGGQLVIEGSSGKCVGRSMRQGIITVRGNSGDFACWGMIDGHVTIKGSAGENAGQSMAGGELRVDGHIGTISKYFQKGKVYNREKLVMTG